MLAPRTDVTAFPVDGIKQDIVRAIRNTGLMRFPVYEESLDEIIGVLNAKQYLLNLQQPYPQPLMEMLLPPYCVPESIMTDDLFRNMQKAKRHFVVLVDEYGGTAGIVTMEDLIEELVGDICDESDPPEERDVVHMAPNLWRVAGDVTIDTLADILDMDLPPRDNYDTLGGLVFSKLYEIPEDGAPLDVTADGLHIQVEKLKDRRVEWALVSKVHPDLPEFTPEDQDEEDGTGQGEPPEPGADPS